MPRLRISRSRMRAPAHAAVVLHHPQSLPALRPVHQSSCPRSRQPEEATGSRRVTSVFRHPAAAANLAPRALDPTVGGKVSLKRPDRLLTEIGAPYRRLLHGQWFAPIASCCQMALRIRVTALVSRREMLACGLGPPSSGFSRAPAEGNRWARPIRK